MYNLRLHHPSNVFLCFDAMQPLHKNENCQQLLEYLLFLLTIRAYRYQQIRRLQIFLDFFQLIHLIELITLNVFVLAMHSISERRLVLLLPRAQHLAHYYPESNYIPFQLKDCSCRDNFLRWAQLKRR